MMRSGLLAAAILAGSMGLSAQPQVPPLDLFFAAGAVDEQASRAALATLEPLWRDGYTPMIVDMARLLRPSAPTPEDTTTAEFADRLEADADASDTAPRPDFGQTLRRPPTPESLARTRLLRFLEQRTGKRFDPQLRGWRRWMWSLPYAPHPDYARFKGELYSRIDRRMARFFPPGVTSLIRLDEIDWGGVTVNGIPPLYHPKVLPAADARYLRDGHIVFGLVVNGEARAYPKRILAWHEMARDRLGGIELHVVYCTLCGTVIPYESVAGNRTWRLGTSGLLYRSNKLMFDEDTGSLWSTLEGRPVVGELVGKDLQLQSRPVVTTTWGEWRAQHPSTTVLSLDTGHTRDYSEGAAYRDYFSRDDLYFQVPEDDRRLKNKAEILTLRVRPAASTEAVPVAISQALLRRQPVYPLEVAGRRFLVVTSREGANRVYALGTSDVVFQSRRPDDQTVVDGSGRAWRVTEDALVSADGAGGPLPRVAAQRAFWFGWRAQFPDTLLLQ